MGEGKSSSNGAPRLVTAGAVAATNGAAAAAPAPVKKRVRRYVLSETELAMIAAYKYKPGSYTYFDNVMTPFWNRAVTWLPRWTAPNLVTFWGLSTVALASAPLMYYSPSLQEPVPRWIYYMLAVALFAYQTLDAIDGKQARRTNSSSPLGQLFDHGCDALVKVFLLIDVLACQRFGSGWRAMLVLCNTELAFYMAQWEEYHTGTLNWSNGWVGVTETQFTQMAIFLAAAVGGEDIWRRPLLLAPWESAPLTAGGGVGGGGSGGWLGGGGLAAVTVEEAMLGMFSVVTASMVVGSFRTVAAARREALPADELGQKQVGLLPGLVQLLPLVLVLSLGALLGVGPAGKATFATHPALLLLTVETIAVHITTRMIVHHMAKQPLWLQDLRCPAIPALAAAALNCHWHVLGLGEAPPLTGDVALQGVAAVAVASYLYYVVGVVRDICNHSGVRCFHIRHPRID